MPRAAVLDDDPLLVIFTSGSEAAPKGVVLTHANCFWNNLALAQALPLTADDVVLAMLPQFHVAAWNCQPLLAWWVGATVVLERSFQPRTRAAADPRAPRHRDDGRADAVRDARRRPRLARHRPLVACASRSSAGATMPPALHGAWADRGVPLTQGYGLTEAAPNVLHLPPAEAAAHAGRRRAPVPARRRVRVADPETLLPLEGEATGELWVRGPSVFAGYLGDDAATARAMRGEWLRTGDLVHRDADGVFRIVDRIKDIFISGGENVAPAEVEYALGAASAHRGRRRRRACPTRSGASAASRSSCPSPARCCRPTRCSRTRAAISPRSRCPCAWSSSTRCRARRSRSSHGPASAIARGD